LNEKGTIENIKVAITERSVYLLKYSAQWRWW